ncbi:hypothetical protein CkaCkLH20_03436 [Colletotrichum karsti]|uniref:Uncharacterized protein n=1 Tax=Colletotrichum karsti TaxID=1095194 RepID=A0A9P6I8L5_9PEZI|nr:uncharacterized protein CkaCkLH20_03436 [Colletotrichum karsti]KAF9879203.1 hypothetical protein CkaCkLH20_03436 [Colletotrichum karsti]
MAPPVPTATETFIASLTQTLRRSAYRSDSRWVVSSYSELTEHEQRLKARERTADESTVLIGTLLRDAEVSRKRSANGDVRPVAQHRRQGAPVYLKININWQLENIVFMLCDCKGANFGPHIDFEMREGYHLGLAKGLCTANWDASERRRIGAQNTQQQNLGGRETDEVNLPGQADLAAIAGQPTTAIDDNVDLTQLIRIRFCQDL